LGFRVWGVGFRVLGVGSRVSDSQRMRAERAAERAARSMRKMYGAASRRPLATCVWFMI